MLPRRGYLFVKIQNTTTTERRRCVLLITGRSDGASKFIFLHNCFWGVNDWLII
jgi:hypothetical protein